VRMGKGFQEELQSARAERERVLEENKRLRQLLTDHGIRIPATQTQGPTLLLVLVVYFSVGATRR